MILRGLFAASLSLLLCGASLAGFARAFDWHKSAPPPRCYDPARFDPPVLHPDAPDAKMPDWARDWLEQQSS
jgi:hypothetical protein